MGGDRFEEGHARSEASGRYARARHQKSVLPTSENHGGPKSETSDVGHVLVFLV
jgi:hypothetical protein